MPAMAALAAFVPCADEGMRHTVRCVLPFARCQARMARRPASSPCEPALGWSDTASYPVISTSMASSSRISSR